MNSLSTGLANAVMYDNTDHSKVTLGGSGHTPVTLTNVADGSSQYDAVNFGQLSSLSFGNSTDKLRITHIADGVNDDDVATVGQLKETSLYKDGTNGKPKAAVTFDTTSTGETDYSNITLAGKDGTTIHNVSTAIAPTDLVNKAQLDALSSQIANITTSDNPLFAADGNRATEAAVASGTHATASGAKAQATGANSVANGSSAVASGVGAVAIGANTRATADDSVALGASSVADRANTVSVGAAGSERQITNVAAGTEGADLVNVNQLNDAVTQSNSYTDSVVNGMQGAVAEVGRNAYSGIAAATALAMIPNIDQDKIMSVGVGGATYQGYAAAAVAVNLRVTQNLVLKAGAGSSRNGTVYGANASYRW
ncbi:MULTISPECIES: YadA-like family protein [unclassified Caballeronia]|uniref:YadA family autotransporter adhesin n=1 Tax=unclassified Caballeronia TaxID=2646786 RepID=UPI002028DE86|nr:MULTISPECIES: YadA-like family protein [unclassified Caballeronia]MDR5766095.1 YadA-like family protein [Caballeronia sp. LZ028]